MNLSEIVNDNELAPTPFPSKLLQSDESTLNQGSPNPRPQLTEEVEWHGINQLMKT